MHYLIGFGISHEDRIPPGTFAILGATALLSGSTRMTYSLAVIMLETTSSVELFLPIIFTLFASYGTGALLINKSIYLSALRSKNIPLLLKDIPEENKHLLASKVMSAPPRCLNFVCKIKDVYYQLENTTFQGFPVINSNLTFIGMIERDVLITLIEKRAWYYPNDYKIGTFTYKKYNTNHERSSLNNRALSAASDSSKNMAFADQTLL